MKRQIYLTPAEGKRLIAKGLASDERVLKAAREHTLVIIGGTTNGYAAEEILKALGLGTFDRSGFFRGIFKGPQAAKLSSVVGDIMIRKGELITGRVIDDIEPELEEGDMILKGGNALYLKDRQVGVVIGNARYGTLDHIGRAYFGRRVAVIAPIGLEKRVELPITELMKFVNAPDCTGTRLALSPGEPYTETDALSVCGVRTILLSSGGVAGFEGSVLLVIEGTEDQIKAAEELIKSVKGEPVFGEDL